MWVRRTSGSSFLSRYQIFQETYRRPRKPLAGRIEQYVSMMAHGYVLYRHCFASQPCVLAMVSAVSHNFSIRGKALFLGSFRSICGDSSSVFWTLRGTFPWRCLVETIREVAWIDRLMRMICGNLPQQISPWSHLLSEIRRAGLCAMVAVSMTDRHCS